MTPDTTISDLDRLMDLIHTINAKDATNVTDHDIEVLITYHRYNRQQRAMGKTTKAKSPSARNLDELLGITKSPALAPKTYTGTLRRI